MTRRSKKVILRCLSVVALLSLSGCDGFLHVRGVVRDTVGRPISGARVRLEHGDGRKFEEEDRSARLLFGRRNCPSRKI